MSLWFAGFVGLSRHGACQLGGSQSYMGLVPKQQDGITLQSHLVSLAPLPFAAPFHTPVTPTILCDSRLPKR